jgi:hypothetical protein
VHSFLGFANYFRKYIRAYSGIVAPLSDLLKGIDRQDKEGKLLRYNKLPSERVRRLMEDCAQKWTPRCQHAFQTIKQALISAPVLTLPDLAKPFEVVCDACEVPPAVNVGAVLLQKGRPLAFYSRKLSGPELLYSVSDIEMLAVIPTPRHKVLTLCSCRLMTLMISRLRDAFAHVSHHPRSGIPLAITHLQAASAHACPMFSHEVTAKFFALRSESTLPVACIHRSINMHLSSFKPYSST